MQIYEKFGYPIMSSQAFIDIAGKDAASFESARLFTLKTRTAAPFWVFAICAVIFALAVIRVVGTMLEHDISWGAVAVAVFVGLGGMVNAASWTIAAEVAVCKTGICYCALSLLEAIVMPREEPYWKGEQYDDMLFVDARKAEVCIQKVGQTSPTYIAHRMSKEERRTFIDKFLAHQKRGEIPAKVDVKDA